MVLGMKGTAQDCMDHLRISHHADSSVELQTLGRYFPPWTVTRATWTTALRGPVMSQLACVNIQASAMARWAIVSYQTPAIEVDFHLVRQDHRATEYTPPA